MEYSDDEQVEKLKVWWKSYGPALIAGVILGLGGLYGGKYWKQLQFEKAVQSSVLFDQLVYHVQNKDNINTKLIGSRIIEEFDRTPYAGLTALILARVSYDENDKDRAKRQLAWAMDNGKEEGVRQVSRIRLGRLLLDENKVEEANSLLSTAPVAGFEFEYYELKGDVLKKKGNMTGARSAYQQALSNAGNTGPYANMVRMKLDDLG